MTRFEPLEARTLLSAVLSAEPMTSPQPDAVMMQALAELPVARWAGSLAGLSLDFGGSIPTLSPAPAPSPAPVPEPAPPATVESPEPASPLPVPVSEPTPAADPVELPADLQQGQAQPPALPTTQQVDPAQVLDRHIFYNGSAFDGNGVTVTEADGDAIAIDKNPLLPGQTAGFANYTSFDRGINGVFIDIDQLADPAGLSAADLSFRVSDLSATPTWTAAPTPTQVSVLAGAGVEGSDRVAVTFADSAIVSQWLEVTVLPTAATGLAYVDVHYWGNAPGESGDNPGNAGVTAADELGARNNPHNFLSPAAIDDAYDYNRDARVTAADQLIARNNGTNFFNRLPLIESISTTTWKSPGDPVTATTPYLETFGGAAVNDMLLESGRWSLASGGLITQGSATPATPSIVTVPMADALPDAYRISATINARPPAVGYSANAGIVFDFRSMDDYKVASVDLQAQVSSVAHVVNGVTVTEKLGWSPSDTGVDHELSVLVQDGEATLRIDGFKLITARYGGDLHTGRIGIWAEGSQTRFDNVAVRDAAVTLPYSQAFDDPEITGWTDRWGQWVVADGQYSAEPVVETGDAVVSLLSVQGGLPEAVRLTATATPEASSGAVGPNALLVFDDLTSRPESFPAPVVPQRGDAGLTAIAGDLEVDDAWVAANGTVLENADVEGFILVKADGVTIRNVVADRLAQTLDSTGLIVEDALFTSTDIGENVGLVLWDAAVTRVQAIGHNDGAQIYGGNVTITDAMLDISQDRPDNHSDAIQVFAPGLALERVSLLARGKTAAINQSGHAVTMTDVSLDGTIFAAAGSSYVNVAAVNPDDVRYNGRPVPEEVPWSELEAGVAIWDVRLKSDFKAAGINSQADTAFVMHVVNGEAVSVTAVPLAGLSADTAYVLSLELDADSATLWVDGTAMLTESFATPPTAGQLGLGAWGSGASFDDVTVLAL